MAQGSIALPGAVILTNTLTDVNKSRLITQLHIDEAITGEDFDIRLAADPNYVYNIRTLRRRLLVTRDLRDSTNREYVDVVVYISHGMASIESNCLGPPGQTYLLKDLYWGKLCIYNTDVNRTCSTCGCSTPCSCSTCSTDGYCRSPYYPATYDPYFPAENHSYNQVPTLGVFGRTCAPTTDRYLCTQYLATASGCIPLSGCRCVKQ